MGVSPDCRDLSAGMALGPELFRISPRASHLLDIKSCSGSVRYTLGGIWRAVGDYAANEPGPRGPFPVSFVLAGAAPLAGSYAVVGPWTGSDQGLRPSSDSMDGSQLRRFRQAGSHQG